MVKFYCQCCGISRSTISSLTGSTCSKNANGKYHSLYEGSEKAKYTCKYCGISRSAISALTGSTCSKNTNGKYHTPTL